MQCQEYFKLTKRKEDIILKNILNTTSKIIILIVIINIYNLFLYKDNVYAASGWSDIFSQGENFINQGKNSNTDINEVEFKALYKNLYNFLLAIGIIITIIVGALLGLKYMFGSIEQQVKVKETLLPYLVGCIIIFGAFGIWKIVLIFAQNIV